MNLLFIVLAATLAAAVVLLLAPVLWRGAKTGNEASDMVNAAVLRDQLTELERDHANGILTDGDRDQAKQELQRRVLEEADAASSAAAPGHRSKRAAIMLSILLPLAATVVYLALGNPAVQHAARAPQVTQADVETMVASLADKLKRNPDNPHGWAMLGRSYHALGRYDDAAQAFAKAGAAIDADPQLLFGYAEALARTRGGALRGEPTRLLEQALKLDPQFPAALALAGSAAFGRGDYGTAIKYWQRLQVQLPPDTDAAKALAEGIQKARSAQTGNDGSAPLKSRGQQ